jgi:tellurite resistance-related uncharacterized protein
VKRAIEGFHRDELGDWVADLRCGHGQHVRHKPPFWTREWVLTEDGRASRIGIELDCVRCDRFEVPEGFEPYKRTIDFTERNTPPGLLAHHSTKPGVWGVIHVVAGQLTYIVGPPLEREVRVDPSHPAVIVPEVAHCVRPGDTVRFFVEFHRRSNDPRQSAP